MLFSKATFENMISFHVNNGILTYDEYTELSVFISELMMRVVSETKNDIPKLVDYIDKIVDTYELEISKEKISSFVYIYATHDSKEYSSIMIEAVKKLGFDVNFPYGVYLITYEWHIVDYFARKFANRIKMRKTFPKNKKHIRGLKEIIESVSRVK